MGDLTASFIKRQILRGLLHHGGELYMNGTVKFFNRSKGFGFIAGEDGKEYFVHQSALPEGLMLNDNDQVTFDVEEGERGPKAVNVAKAE
jgi:CspA family cold shock protein